jgi:hypothetical protein
LNEQKLATDKWQIDIVSGVSTIQDVWHQVIDNLLLQVPLRFRGDYPRDIDFYAFEKMVVKLSKMTP